MNKNWLLFTFLLAFYGLTAQKWEDTYENALQKSKTEDKPIVLVFSGSDWCAPCIKLDKDIWQSDAFKKEAAAKYVLYRADFPRKKGNQLSEELQSSNKKLAEKFNGQGYFPLVVILDKNEKVLGTTAYKRLSPTQYIDHLNSFVH